MPVDMNTTPTSSASGAPPSPAAIHAAENRIRFSGGALFAVVLVVVALLVLIVLGIRSRSTQEHALVQSTNEAAIPSVNIVHPDPAGLTSELILPGNTQAFTDTPIYARTNGYLKQWFFDIGARVQKGQLMATIETPELDQQLQAAQAALKSSQADLNLANTTSTRYQDLLKTNSVSKQETDQAVSGAAAKMAIFEEAEANVRRLRELQSFESVYAPFSGIVTARNTDLGALIDAGSASGGPKELFHLAATGRLRVYVAVPEAYFPAIHDGAKVDLTLDEYPGQIFPGTIARNSNSIDQVSRTLNVEIDVDNTAGKLLPGAYAFVHFKVPPHAAAVSIPSDALLFRSEGLRAVVVRNNHAHLQPIEIGHDNGRTVEVITGLQTSDLVVSEPPDSISEGQQVKVRLPKSTPPAGGAAK